MGQDDVKGDGRKTYIEKNLGIPVEHVSTRHLYVMEGSTPDDAKEAGRRLLADKVIEYFEVFEDAKIYEQQVTQRGFRGSWLVRVGYKTKPLVLDAWGDSTSKALSDIGITATSVRHLEEFEIRGELTEKQIRTICKEKLADEKVQLFTYIPLPPEAKKHA
jgi:phosphoribosylformylglycinamidine (FGAM) synthase PurS component